jgi:hypothetical protein
MKITNKICLDANGKVTHFFKKYMIDHKTDSIHMWKFVNNININQVKKFIIKERNIKIQ